MNNHQTTLVRLLTLANQYEMLIKKFQAVAMIADEPKAASLACQALLSCSISSYASGVNVPNEYAPVATTHNNRRLLRAI